jgi:hypothetical protein
MKKLIVILISILLLVCLVSCSESEHGNIEYEVLTVAPYTIITGKNDSGPVEEMRLAFIYMDNGTPKLIKDYFQQPPLSV